MASSVDPSTLPITMALVDRLTTEGIASVEAVLAEHADGSAVELPEVVAALNAAEKRDVAAVATAIARLEAQLQATAKALGVALPDVSGITLASKDD